MSLHRPPEIVIAFCFGVVLVVCVATPACGPFFPNQLLIQPDESALWAPVADFDVELRSIITPGSGEFHAVLPSDHKQDCFAHSREADLAELQASLAAHPVARSDGANMVGGYAQVRMALEAHFRAAASQTTSPAPPEAAPVNLGVPDGLPPEFAEYLRGSIAFANNQPDAAGAAWKRVLDLPAGERHYRSVWAAYMLGRSCVQDNPVAAVRWFEQARVLVKQGFADQLGLACESLGWQARAEWNQGHLASAINLYLAQYAGGDKTARNSLLFLCDDIFEKHLDELNKLAADPGCARVVTADVLANGGQFHARLAHPQEWLRALEAANVGDMVGADRLAWAAYQAGDFAMAQRWAARAPDKSGIGLWVRGKLALRGGKLDSAAELLARASRAFPDNEEWAAKGGYEFEEGMRPSRRAAGELGVLRLARGQYVDALDTLMKGRWWLDAAYIAERVLTVDELLRYCKADPKPVARHKSDPSAHQEPDNCERLRQLLARRLTRIGRWKEARPFFALPLQEKLDSYIQLIRAGHDESRSAIDRGRSLWSAARIARESGLELLGTELDPDDAAVEGQFEGFDVATDRSRHDQEHSSKLLLPTADELRRAAAGAPDPNKRWHYRYIAADHAWAAAELLPDNSNETAQILYEAGMWLIPRDPRAADRFYRALVSRCGTTVLGKAALTRRWFPPADDPAVAALPR